MWAKSGVAVVAPEEDLLFTEALVQTLREAIPTLDGARHVGGFDQAFLSLRRLRPSVVLVVLQRRSSAEDVLRFADDLRRTMPDGRLVVIADDDEDVVAAVEAGAMAVVSRSTDLQVLLDAIRAAANGERTIDPEKLHRAMLIAAHRRLDRAEISGRLERLTDRERDVLRLVGDGARNKDIASNLHISCRTVDTHMTSVLRKLDVHSKLEAAALLRKARISHRGVAVRDSVYAETGDPSDGA